ncbi:MAG: hypothetical protein OSJ59_01075 [Lachnospiraceae bacterium]|nr:hypothetical protein [Lachnospiraceae bacterium]
MTEMDDGKVILKKVIIADEEEPGTAAQEKVSSAVSKKVIIADTEFQEETAAPVLSDDIKMLVTSMIHKEGKAFARVSFLRDSDWAEGIVPGGKIEKAEGFSEEEIEKLEAYLAGEQEMILQEAKGVNPIKNLFGMP